MHTHTNTKCSTSVQEAKKLPFSAETRIQTYNKIKKNIKIDLTKEIQVRNLTAKHINQHKVIH